MAFRDAIVLFALVACTAAVGAPVASAQITHASAATLGLAGNVTATARRFAAMSVNPAGLGLRDHGFSLTIFPLQKDPGLAPVTLGDLLDLDGRKVSSDVAVSWLERIEGAGGQTGVGRTELTAFALTFWYMGIQLSTLMRGEMDLSPTVADLLLSAAPDRARTRVSSTAPAPSSVTGFALSTLSGSFAVPVKSDLGEFALGATIKYTVGHAMVLGRSRTTRPDLNEFALDFPTVVVEDQPFNRNNGWGIGLDLGFQLDPPGPWQLGGAVLNATHSFRWNRDSLVYRPRAPLLAVGDLSKDTLNKRPYREAPDDLQDLVEEMQLRPVIALGAALDAVAIHSLLQDLTLTLDARYRDGDGMAVTSKFEGGLGAEYQALAPLLLRGGVAAVDEFGGGVDGVKVAGGASLVLGGINVTGGFAWRTGSPVRSSVRQLTLSFAGR